MNCAKSLPLGHEGILDASGLEDWGRANEAEGKIERARRKDDRDDNIAVPFLGWIKRFNPKQIKKWQ